MKIAHVCICSHVFCEKYAYQDNLLSKYHRKLGHDVTIIAPTYSEFEKNTGKILKEPAGEKIIDGGIRLIRLKPMLPCSINQHLHLFFNLKSTLESIKPDLIFVHSVDSLNYRSLASYKKLHPLTKIVFDNHADSNNSNKNIISYFYSRYIVRHFVIKKIVDLSDYFYGVTPARCTFLYEINGVPQDKIHLLPMGADDEEMHKDCKKEIRKEIRDRYNISDNDFLIVTGGKIDPLKNIHTLAKAVSDSKFMNIKILIFGSIRDDLKDVFNKLKSDRVLCIGWLPSNEVYNYFFAADLVMFPGLHSVLWEQAVASEVPCAFSHITGFEHIDIGGNCLLMESKDAGYYQHIVEDIYNDEKLYCRMKSVAQSDASRQFLYSHIAQKVINDVTSNNIE